MWLAVESSRLGVSVDTPDFVLETRLETLETSRDYGEAELQLPVYLHYSTNIYIITDTRSI